ncbi:MAG: sigma 54-interacting transcriptional regulator [Deltaproteobacteria bacterium]|nr:sigma 54-interacting transcriptional regulator [Deltaproteobacteria bacterium]
MANRETLFLEEVNGLPLDLRAKLLRVLQQNEILRLGDTRPIEIDVRVLTASNCDLMAEVENARGGNSPWLGKDERPTSARLPAEGFFERIRKS